MKRRTRMLIGVVAIACGIAAIARATPIVGLLVGTLLSSGKTADVTVERARVALPEAPLTGDGNQDDAWVAKLSTSGPSDFIVQDVVYAPAGHTGWHSHPGILLITMVSGSIEWYDAQCGKHVYNPGDSFTEGTQLHYLRNVGAVNAHFTVTYVIAHGQPRRIDQPAPDCAAALNLE